MFTDARAAMDGLVQEHETRARLRSRLAPRINKCVRYWRAPATADTRPTRNGVMIAAVTAAEAGGIERSFERPVVEIAGIFPGSEEPRP